MRRPLAMLAVGSVVVALGGCARQPAPDAARRVADLQDQIETLQAINRLQLTPDQMQKLREILRSAAEQERAREAQCQKLEAALIPLLEQKRDAALADEPVPPTVEQQIRQIQEQLAQLTSPQTKANAALAAKLRGVLTPEQIAIVAGGLDARIEAADALDGFRGFPADEFEAQISDYARELVGESDTKSAEKVEALFREARSLSDAEYAANKDKVLDQLAPLYAQREGAADQLLAEYFSKPHILELLERKAGGARR